MPNRKAPLSAKDIDEFRPPQYPYRLGCGNGLYLYYQHSMTSWQVRVRMPGVNTWLTLDEYGRADQGKINLSEARKR